MPDIIPTTQSRLARATLHQPDSPIPALLAQRTGDVIVGPAVVRFSYPARDQYFGGAGFRGIGVEALSLLETFGLAELIGAELAVRRAVCRNGTYHAPRDHGGRLGQARQRLARIL